MDFFTTFILEMASAARACGLYDRAADLFLAACARSADTGYLRQANECRALAQGLTLHAR